MADLITVARPYARAAFVYALDNNQTEDWSKMFGALSLICQDTKVAESLASPTLDASSRADLFVSLGEEWLNEAMRNFIFVLAENYRLSLLPSINTVFAMFVAQRQKTLSVQISLATQTEDALVDKLKKQISKKLGQEIELASSIDASLLAGAVIRIGDTVIDGSLRGRLRQLAESL